MSDKCQFGIKPFVYLFGTMIFARSAVVSHHPKYLVVGEDADQQGGVKNIKFTLTAQCQKNIKLI